LVDEILTDCDAYRRGLRPDDEIVSFAGRPIGSANQFKNVLGIFPKGWRVELTYRRDERKRTIRTRLLGVHRSGEIVPERPTPPDGKKPDKKPKVQTKKTKI